jgi:hypothetical protein
LLTRLYLKARRSVPVALPPTGKRIVPMEPGAAKRAFATFDRLADIRLLLRDPRSLFFSRRYRRLSLSH